MLEYLITAAFQ